MSTATATRPAVRARVQPAVTPVREVHPRRIEIVTSKEQRRARPKVVHAVVTLGALFVIFAAQLLLSIAVSDGAYQIAALQQTEKELARTEAALAEDLAALESPQHLVADAASLGMVMASQAAYLRLADGAVFTAPSPQIRYGCTTMCGLVGNALTKDMPPVTAPVAGTPTTGTTAGAKAGTGTTTNSQAGQTANTTPPASTGPTTEPLPAPVTR